MKGEGFKESVFKNVANIWRKINCKGKARELLDGEYNYGCHNFTGPGTRIDLPNILNYPPYNDIDNCSKQHDIDYDTAFKNKDQATKQKLIRDADNKVIECYDKYPNENGHDIAKLGINGKMSLEKAIPKISKSFMGEYFGN